MKTKEESIDQVKENNEGFYASALSFSERWIIGKERFTSEDLINDHQDKCREPRVWGAVIRSLSRSGKIVPIGFDTYKGKQGHGKPVRVWKHNN
tara:strand:+ start:316 stop:597 length:282 start_codon:yes stop_codon:yes gene_type:complete